jgi:hypothetical protein
LITDRLECLGEFRVEQAAAGFVDYPLVPPALILQGAHAAAGAAGRRLGPARGRDPFHTEPGDRSYTWRLEGDPPLSVKVLATTERWTRRAFRVAGRLINHLEPPPGLRLPRRLFAGQKPVPWVIEEEAPGIAATTASLSPKAALQIVIAVRQTRIRGWHRLDDWGVRRYATQILGPLDDLVGWSVITSESARRAHELAAAHLERARPHRPVLCHNDLAIHHVFLAEPVPWLIDWENVHQDRLQVLDVAHLMVNHGRLDLEWARRLGELALRHPDIGAGLDLRSNLIVALLERAIGMAYDAIRRQRRQSGTAVEALCAVLRGDLLDVST